LLFPAADERGLPLLVFELELFARRNAGMGGWLASISPVALEGVFLDDLPSSTWQHRAANLRVDKLSVMCEMEGWMVATRSTLEFPPT
jgi:hypothetical protein